MNDSPRPDESKAGPKSTPTFADHVGDKATLKLKARRLGAHNVLLGLGTMGLIGWSVAIPTLLGAALGIWLDDQHAGAHSWTLALLVGGLALGCLNAWRWVANEDRAMHAGQEDRDE